VGITAVSAGRPFVGLWSWGRVKTRVIAEDGGIRVLGPQLQTVTHKTTAVTHGSPVDGSASLAL
jgi:hypothetical protein